MLNYLQSKGNLVTKQLEIHINHVEQYNKEETQEQGLREPPNYATYAVYYKADANC